MDLPNMSAGVARNRLQTPFDETITEIPDINEIAEPVRACIQGLAQMRENLSTFQDNEKFDAEMAVALHETASLPLGGACDSGFWRWLAVEHGRDLVIFRHGVNASLANYGIGRQWDNLFMRSWFRAELSWNGNLKDPYSLTRCGGSDFWASGVVRHRYSSARNMVRALIRFQFAVDDPLNGRLNTAKVRELYKRIRLIHATVSLELLADEECDELLVELSSDLS